MEKSIRSGMTRRKFLKTSAAVGIGITLVPTLGWGAEEKQLNVYNWDTYIGENTLSNFQDKLGVKVQYDLFANNEELFAKLKAGNPGFDVIFPADYMVETMVKVGMLEPLDHSKIPNLKNIDKDPNFSNPAFNPGLKYGVPYMWGTLGIGYRKSKIKTKPTSWKAIYDSPEYSGRIALLSDQRLVLGTALRYLGYSVNTTKQSEIDKATALLIKQKPHIKTFADDNGQDLLISGECDIVFEWSGDIVQVMMEDKDLDYVVPKEGSIVWTDNMCIPKGAPHPENAHAFINYILDPQVNADIANFIHFATPNAAARPLLLQEDVKNPAIYAPAETVAQSEVVIDIGDAARLYDEAWVKVKAS